MDKSDTPRVDAAEMQYRYKEKRGDWEGEEVLSYVEPDFARQLERELSALTAQLAEARTIAWDWGQGVDDAETAVRKLSRMFPIAAMKEPK